MKTAMNPLPWVVCVLVVLGCWSQAVGRDAVLAQETNLLRVQNLRFVDKDGKLVATISSSSGTLELEGPEQSMGKVAVAFSHTGPELSVVGPYASASAILSDQRMILSRAKSNMRAEVTASDINLARRPDEESPFMTVVHMNADHGNSGIYLSDIRGTYLGGLFAGNPDSNMQVYPRLHLVSPLRDAEGHQNNIIDLGWSALAQRAYLVLRNKKGERIVELPSSK